MRCSWATYAVAAFLSGCTPRETTTDNFIDHDLGPLTLQIPASWKALDYDSSKLARGNSNQRYLFTNFQSQDSVRETVIIIIDKRKGIAHVDRAPQHIIKNLSSFPDRTQLIAWNDTLIRNGDLAILETNHRDLETHLEVIQTYGFYKRENSVATVMGTAVSHPEAGNKKNRALFLHMINSIKWK